MSRHFVTVAAAGARAARSLSTNIVLTIAIKCCSTCRNAVRGTSSNRRAYHLEKLNAEIGFEASVVAGRANQPAHKCRLTWEKLVFM